MVIISNIGTPKHKIVIDKTSVFSPLFDIKIEMAASKNPNNILPESPKNIFFDKLKIKNINVAPQSMEAKGIKLNPSLKSKNIVMINAIPDARPLIPSIRFIPFIKMRNQNRLRIILRISLSVCPKHQVFSLKCR